MKQRLLFYCLTLIIFNEPICQIPAGEVLWLKADKGVVADIQGLQQIGKVHLTITDLTGLVKA